MTKPRKWFTTGMSLASVGRSADGTPRGKKEGPAGCSGNQAGDYPPLDKAQLERSSKTFPSGIRHFDLCKSLPTEKPLPSPPVGQIITTGVPAVQRGLLDAADLPLRRSTSSEAGEPGMIEEWPILLPQATSRVNSIQQEDSSTSESPFTGVRLTGLESTPNSVNSSPPQVAATTGAASDGTANRQAVAAAQVQRKLIPRPTQQALNGMKPLSGVSGNVGNLAPRIRASDKPSKLPMKSTTGTENQTVKPAEKKEIRNVRKAELPSGRPSSIPISRKANSPPGSSLESESGVVLSARQMKTARNCIALFEDEQVAGDADVDTDDVVSPAGVKVPNTEGLATLEARSSHGVKAATSRSSHNAHNTRIGTPSKNLPRFGPTLRISSAANSIIMGPAEESGSSSSGKKTSPTLHRAVITKELQKSSTYFNRHFDIKQGAQQTVASGEASAKRSQPRPKSADGDITRMCGLITVRGQKSWSMDAIRLILKGESDIVEGEPQRDDPFIEFQHALKEKADDDTGAQAALKGDDPSPKLAESTDEEKSVQTIGVTRSAISTTKIHVPTSFKSKIPSAQRGPSTGVTLPNNRPKGSRVAHRPQFTPLQRPPSSANSFSSDRPPRSSSRVAVPDFTIASSKVAGSASKRNQPRPAPKGATETQALKDPATVQNLLGPSSGTESTPPKISPSADAKPDSDTSKVSQTPSTKMLAITKIRGLFRKNTSPTSKKPAPKGGKKFTVNNDGSPLASPATGRASAGKPWSRIGRVSRPPGTPPPAKPTINSFPTPGPTPSRPSESAEINALAMSLLNSARDEPNSPRKEHLLALGRAMVESITNARDAEKAMEEAKMAARSAEVYYMKAKQSVLCVTNVVREWQDSEGGANLI
ncbi:MAG: hypothetical protein M1840_008002 [Geoglossum simile]|nr:MAG: hypothetical protein M1840_008002 [Geoglossum simile]